MSEEKNPDVPAQDEMSEEFDEIVAANDDSTDDAADASEGVQIEVKRDRDDFTFQPPSEDIPLIEPEPIVAQVEPMAPVVVAAPVSAPAPVPVPQTPQGSGASMVLQWLSYAFWGWFGVAMGWLAGVTVAYFVTGNSSSVTSALAYPLASVIVMLIVALVADLLYARREPEQKAGGQNVIMLVHVVLFVLITVGAAVTALFSLISMLLNTDPTAGTDGLAITCWTSVVTVFVFGSIALRAFIGGKKRFVRKAHWITMTVLALTFIVLSIVGPAMGAQATKDDRLAEEGLPTLIQGVKEYVNQNGKLPATLSDAVEDSSFTARNAAASALVSRNLVRYTPNIMAATKSSDKLENAAYNDYTYGTTHYYQLCVDYKQVKKANGTYYDTSITTGEKYPSYLTIDAHAKGEVCYKLSATDGYGIVYPMDGTSASSGSTDTSTTTKQ